MFRWIRNSFLAGVIVVLPIAGTIYILFVIFSTLDKIVSPVVNLIFGREIYGLGVVLSLGLIVLAGVIGKNYLGKKLIELSEWLMVRLPIVRPVYTTVKQIIDALFLQGTTTAFKQVVLIEYPRRGIYQLGFLTGSGVGEIQIRTEAEIINVFLPTTPNPTSGMLIMVPREDVIFLQMTVEEGIKLVLSGGVLVPRVEKS